MPKARILVAEDDPVWGELICSHLANWGYEVTLTQSGTEAMTELRKKDAPPLAILDWMMPGMDGLEICRRVREVNRAVYLILLTVRGSKENVVEGLRAGADDYLVKPFYKNELQARILVGLRVMALQTAPPKPSPSVAGKAVPKTRILIAEDDEVSRELICSRLAKWGYEVTVTRNGTEAMTELRKKDAPSLAILDWMMPGMDGLEICRRVREVNQAAYLILLTARGNRENAVEGLGAGADDYLVKPFYENELQARILVGLRAMALRSAPPEPSPSDGLNASLGTKILIAEDNAVSRELICSRLTKWGYELIVTQSGTEAMTELRKKDPPSLAILDWMMPGMDGLEICRRVREVNQAVYIILLTACGSKENVVEGLCAGADDYLIKPFDKNELQARILIGLRVIALQVGLANRLKGLEAAAAEIRERKFSFTL